MAVPNNQQLSMATTTSQHVLDPSLLSEISVVQAPDSSDITIVQGQQPTKKPAKPRGKRAANTANKTTANPSTNTTKNTNANPAADTSSTNNTTANPATQSNDPTEPEEESDKKGRSRTYLEHEDLQLCNSWLEVSEDPKKGTDQTFNAFWEAIARHYATHIPNAPRSAKSLKNHWSDKIQKDVNKFVSCVNQVQQMNPSGTNSANRLTMAMSMYSKLYEKPFTLLGCYEILITSPKWNDYSRGLVKKRETTAATSNKRKEPDSLTSNDPSTISTSTDASIGETTGGGKDSSSDDTCGPLTRPIGRKRAKSDHTAEIAAKKTQESLKKMAQAHSDIAEVAKKQSTFLESQQAAMNRLADESIMCKDLTGASDMMKRYYTIEQAKIMARLEKEQSVSTNPTNAPSNPTPNTSK
ncbi:uncharacterized protein PGTG_20993 [Puccinia graminis f. sp. tritici CRL 75-36-700-3]|uniref:No apical meristem-associated C-terminal domain-containing protein n=1 Tax=Puccinia graminis f. sp. tritici (strain CRL 75-36-700-3 / race SCCL) TaxID=418459 RepID=H6QVB6_PUCGT|nr:uncharacterized protein PGTG_22703 [Puccinia graminis f. sp. tritici CRL 75-36-700-3]XP_003890348.1 uncharacterized protein PGTG_20993 [Puccinia graminis f. sp. tritici CRL 75-36-700-3]EHS62845.1 hypothetical protein PGTG_22703 [Puccinia graminis f. sp. tritici CRL 75-36-700-3]EHS64642.1 hypothetical protein PGTG_20993 [Puccinia graminis f. sp. tritici CRL 75-36-700-3]